MHDVLFDRATLKFIQDNQSRAVVARGGIPSGENEGNETRNYVRSSGAIVSSSNWIPNSNDNAILHDYVAVCFAHAWIRKEERKSCSNVDT